MTMASPPPSEEERRLLREYRLTSVPSRRSSNASTITITSPSARLTPKLVTSGASSSSSTKSNGNDNGITNLLNKSTQQLPNNQDQNGCHNNTSNIAANNSIHHNHNYNHNHHNNHHNHHHHHHHHSSNHKRHKSATPTLELTPEELSRMMELVSGLNYLKLVTSLTNGSGNGNGTIINNEKSSTIVGNCINSTTSTTNDASSCKSYIFEKVDYIKKLSIRRKAYRKLKKSEKQIKSHFTNKHNGVSKDQIVEIGISHDIFNQYIAALTI